MKVLTDQPTAEAYERAIDDVCAVGISVASPSVLAELIKRRACELTATHHPAPAAKEDAGLTDGQIADGIREATLLHRSLFSTPPSRPWLLGMLVYCRPDADPKRWIAALAANPAQSAGGHETEGEGR